MDKDLNSLKKMISFWPFFVACVGLGLGWGSWDYWKKKQLEKISLDRTIAQENLLNPIDQTKQIHLEDKEKEKNPTELNKDIIIKSLVKELSSYACGKNEFRGKGIVNTQITDADWIIVIKRLEESKKRLLTWLDKNRSEISDPVYLFMKSQIDQIQLSLANPGYEADLSWRGIGVWTPSENGIPKIIVGEGFIRWVKHNEKLALFEIVRLLAHGWSPCELKKKGLENPWANLLNCLKINAPNKFEASCSTEEGWAVSTSIAKYLVPNGCEIPLFKNSENKHCLNQLQFTPKGNENL